MPGLIDGPNDMRNTAARSSGHDGFQQICMAQNAARIMTGSVWAMFVALHHAQRH